MAFFFTPVTTWIFWGRRFFFETRVQPSRKHIFFGVLQYEPRFYFAQALDRDGAAKGVKRFDHSWFGTVGYRFRGPINLTFSYAAMLNRSSSFGESFVRHRLAGTAGFALPWKLTLLVQGAAQFSVFPDGVYTSEDMFLQSEDDNFNSASLKLLRALGEYFEIDLKYAFYYDRLARGNGWYMRQVATVGFAAHWQ